MKELAGKQEKAAHAIMREISIGSSGWKDSEEREESRLMMMAAVRRSFCCAKSLLRDSGTCVARQIERLARYGWIKMM